MGLSGKEVDERQSKLVVVKMWEVKQEDVVKVEVDAKGEGATMGIGADELPASSS